MRKKYDIVYSIGRDCACAMYMKQANLRIVSGPFDWLTNADFETRFELILNDFKDFFNKEDLKFLKKSKEMFNDENCEYYENIRNGFYFFHDFPIGKSFEEVYDSIKEKYDRRIQRFYDDLSRKEHILLIWFSHLHTTPDDVVLFYSEKLKVKLGKDVDLLIVEHTENLMHVEMRRLGEHVVRCNCHTQLIDMDNGNLTLGNELLVLPIFQQYSLRKRWYTSCFVGFRKILLKIACLFIWDKKKRKLFRQNNR